MKQEFAQFVKSLTPVRFPKFSILPEKTRKSRQFWPTIETADVLLILNKLSGFFAIMKMYFSKTQTWYEIQCRNKISRDN